MKMGNFFSNSSQIEKSRSFRKVPGSSAAQITFCKLMQHQHNEGVVVAWRLQGSASSIPILCCQESCARGPSSSPGQFLN